MMRPSPTRERKLQATIVKTLNTTPLGVWAVSNIVVKKSRANFQEVTGLGTGSPDVWIAVAGGPSIFLEIKTEEGKVSEAQEAWHAQARRFGVEVYVVRSVEEAVTTVTNVLRIRASTLVRRLPT